MKRSEKPRVEGSIPERGGARVRTILLIPIFCVVMVTLASCGVIPNAPRECTVSISVMDGSSPRTFWPEGDSSFYLIDRFRIRAEGPDGRLVDQLIVGAPNGATVEGFVRGAWSFELTAYGQTGGTWYAIAVGSASRDLDPGHNTLEIALSPPEGAAPGWMYFSIGWGVSLSNHHIELRIEEDDGTIVFGRTYANGSDPELGNTGFSTSGMLFAPGLYRAFITLYNAADEKRWGMAESVYIASNANTSVQYSSLPITASVIAPMDSGMPAIRDGLKR